jgi:hypothetical protein
MKVSDIRGTVYKGDSMFEPNEMLVYLVETQEQESQVEEMPQWLITFLADDEDYDIFSK